MITLNKQQEQQEQTSITPEAIEVAAPGPVSRLKWTVMRGLLSTVGRMSKCVRIGYRCGFDSGITLDYVYLNKAQGALGIGKLIDKKLR